VKNTLLFENFHRYMSGQVRKNESRVETEDPHTLRLYLFSQRYSGENIGCFRLSVCNIRIVRFAILLK
jgi:hypothetical protein